MTIITIFTIILAIALKSQISPIQYTRLAALSLLLSAFLSFNVLYTESLGSGLGMFSGLFQVSSLSQGIETFIFVVASLIMIPWFINPANANKSLPYGQIAGGPVLSEYPLIILFSVLGASLLISSADLISMYLSIELQSFAVYILATLHRDSEGSTSAGLKYFLLGGLSSCFILLGSALIYALTGLTNLESIFSLVFSTMAGGGDENSMISIIGLLFIVIGFLFKIAAAPLHNWAPDVYDEVPSIVTTWLTIMPKISIVIFLLDLVTSTIVGSGNITENVSVATWSLPLQNLLLISSLLSLIIGSVVGLAQYKIKRLLAYSTISHVGFLLLALGINTEQSTESLIFYILQYSITNLDTFLVLLALGYTIKARVQSGVPVRSNSMDIRYISELKAQFVSNPLLTLSLALCLFSMAGIPPLVGFFAKQQILYSASYSGYYFMTVVAILVSVISCSYYLQIIKVMHFSPNLSITSDSKGESRPSMISNTHSVLISILTLSIMLFILNPNIILNSSHLLALTIFNT